MNKVSKYYFDFTEKKKQKEEKSEAEMMKELAKGMSMGSSQTNIQDEPTSLLKLRDRNEFAITTIKDKKKYIINFKDDFTPNLNISSDLAMVNYERLKIKDEDKPSDRIGPDMLVVQIKLRDFTK